MTSTQAIREEREQLLEAEARRQVKAAEMRHKFHVPIPAPISADIEGRMAKLQETVRQRAPERDEQKVQDILKCANVPRLHAGRKEFTGEPWTTCLAGLKAKLGSGFIVALIGVRGAGKTQIGACLIHESAERLTTAMFTTAMDIFLAIKSSYRRDASTDERAIVDSFCRPRLLVIDEIQERAESQWEDRILTHLLNRRYNDEKDTLLIGNLTKDAFCAAMGASIVSRLNETGGIISCEWESFRK